MKISELHTKIVATVGPSTNTRPMIRRMISSGVNVVRLNFAHGSHEEHSQRIRLVREAARDIGVPVGILQDLPGPKIRVGRFPGGAVDLRPDEIVQLVHRFGGEAGKVIPISYPRLTSDLKPGHAVYIADGLIRLVVQSVRGEAVRCRVTNGGQVRSGNGVNMPQSSLILDAFTREDRRHLEFGIKQGVDFVGISFVGNAEDVAAVRAFCRKRRANTCIVAKIERQDALRNLSEIINAADAVMVARGDLGVEVHFSEIPSLQKMIVSEARMAGKPVIVATQVLESMIQNPRPTRAEATDISNSILEGADAIMLSGETAAGKFPLESVTALAEVIGATERREFEAHVDASELEMEIPDIVSKAACKIADRVGARYVVIPTRSGKAAVRVSRSRPSMPILAMARSEALQRRLTLSWGVQCLHFVRKVRHHDLASEVRTLLLRAKLARSGDRIILVGDDPDSRLNHTSMVKVLEI